MNDVFDEVYADTKPLADNTKLNTLSGEVGKGLTFGFMDELQGLEAQLQNNFSRGVNRLTGYGYDSPISGSEAYANKVAALRARDANFEAENPYSAMGLQAAGAMVPALATGGANLLARAPIFAAETAVPYAGKLAQVLTGAGMGSKALTVKQLAGMGAAQGGLYGAGEATEGNRLEGLGIGGLVGGVAAPVVGKALEYGTTALGDLYTNLLSRNPKATTIINPEVAGSILPSETAIIPETGVPSSSFGFSPEELYVAKQAKNINLDSLPNIEREMAQAVSEGKPIFLPEALQSHKVDRNARYIANSDPAIEYSKQQINERSKAAGSRLAKLMNVVSPEVDPASAGVSLQNASQKAVKELSDARREATAPIYKLLENEQVPIETALPLLEDPVVTEAMKSVSSNPTFQKQLGGASQDSFQFLQLTKEHLDDQVNKLKNAGNRNEARIVGESRDSVKKALNELPQFQEVNAEYARLSKPINRLEGSKDSAGLLEGVLKTDRLSAHEIPAKLLELTPNQILEAKAALGERGQEELSKSARSLMQDVLEQANEKRQPALLLLNTEGNQDKFKALLGDKVYKEFKTSLDLEKRFAEGNIKYHPGSSTFGNFEEAKQHKKNLSLVRKIATGDITGSLEQLFSGDLNEETAKKIAKIYFDPKTGLDTLKKISPLLEKYARNAKTGGIVGAGAGETAAKSYGMTKQESAATPKMSTAADVFDEIYTPSKVTPKEAEAPKLTPIASQLNGLKPADRIAKVKDFVDEQPMLVRAVIATESSGDPFAQSPTGPVGLMQLTSATAKAYGAKDRLDPRQNVEAGTKFFNELLKKYNHKDIAIAAFQSGETVMNKAIKKAGKTRETAKWEDVRDYLPQETQNYPSKVNKNLRNILSV